ncbi:MAG TPA: histidine phosphatase family protein [Ramlibacter sp.]
MTTFLLVRHGAHDWLRRGIAGRMSGVALNAEGQAQAHQLVERLRDRTIAAIYSSPVERAQQTAAPLVKARGLAVAIDDAFSEIDFGEWTGRTFAELEADHDRWRTWCDRKSLAAAPGGEAFTAVQRRVLDGLEGLRRRHPDEAIVVFSHGDIIKAAVAGVLGLSVDHIERFEIAPASVSVIDAGNGWSKVKLVNG